MRIQRLSITRVLAGLCLILPLALVGACRKDAPAPSPADSASPTSGQPKLELPNRRHDFGALDEGVSASHEFTLKNSGTAPLKIDQVRTTCGCTVAELETKELGPGASTKLAVKFNTKNRQGAQRKTITITSNDPESPHTLEIAAKVTPLLAFETRHLRLDTAHGEDKAQDTWITGKLAQDAKLTIKKVDGAELDGRKAVDVKLTTQKDGEATKQGLNFKLSATKVGSGRGTVEVETGVEQVPTLKLWFSWNVTGNLQGIPQNLYFSGRGPRGSSRVMHVRSKREDFKLKAAKVLSGPFKASIEVPDAGNAIQVKVDVTEPEEQRKDGKPRSGKLELVSNDPLEPRKIVNLTLGAYRPPRGPRGGPHHGRPGRPGGQRPGPMPKRPPPPPQAPQQ
jgi:hypothetical protein